MSAKVGARPAPPGLGNPPWRVPSSAIAARSEPSCTSISRPPGRNDPTSGGLDGWAPSAIGVPGNAAPAESSTAI